MNIQNRLKKLESKITGIDEPLFCPCYEKYWQSEIDRAYNEDPDVKIEIAPKPDFTTDVCGMCKKPFSQKDVEMEKTCEEIYGGMDQFVSAAQNLPTNNYE